MDTLVKLCDRGYMDQLMISHDYVSFVDIGDFEWCNVRGTDPDAAQYNHRYIHRFVLPLLLERGFTQAEIDRLLIENPRRFFAEM